MPDLKTLRELLGLPSSLKGTAAVNRVIRLHMPGGEEVLNVIARLQEALHGRTKENPMLRDMLDALVTARDKMAEAILAAELREDILHIVNIRGKKMNIDMQHANFKHKIEITRDGVKSIKLQGIGDYAGTVWIEEDTAAPRGWRIAGSYSTLAERVEKAAPWLGTIREKWTDADARAAVEQAIHAAGLPPDASFEQIRAAVVIEPEATVPAGEYILGDPCHFVPRSVWTELLESSDYFKRPVGTVDGFDVVAFPTSDGTCLSNLGHILTIDAGLIGLTPLALAEKNKTEDRFAPAHVVKFAGDTRCCADPENPGVWRFGDIRVEKR
jgi:hypothetical protein